MEECQTLKQTRNLLENTWKNLKQNTTPINYVPLTESVIKALFNKLSIIYPTTWRPPRDERTLQLWINEWRDCLSNVHESQVSEGLKLIKLGKTEFNKFPPNPVEFRQLCLNFHPPKLSYQNWLRQLAPKLWNGYWVNHDEQLMHYVGEQLGVSEEILRTFLLDRYEEYLNGD